MTIEEFQVQILEELASGEILYITENEQVDYILHYTRKREHFCKKEWIDNVLPHLKQKDIEVGRYIITALVLPGAKVKEKAND